MDKLTQADILAIARRKGHFHVSLRYRDDYLREKCKQLVKKGLLARVPWWKMGERGSWFVPVPTAQVTGEVTAQDQAE